MLHLRCIRLTAAADKPKDPSIETLAENYVLQLADDSRVFCDKKTGKDYWSNVKNPDKRLYCPDANIITKTHYWTEKEEMEDRLKELFNQFRCPTCQGLSINDSEAGFSVQIRNKIKELLQAGASDDEIRAHFVERYGEWILRSPPKEGFNLLLWILPGMGIVAGLLILFRFSQKWVQKQKAEAKVDSPLSPEEEKILQADLTRFQNH